jgi:hypothetical protein
MCGHTTPDYRPQADRYGPPLGNAYLKGSSSQPSPSDAREPERTLLPTIAFAWAGDLLYDAARGRRLSAASRERGEDVLREAARVDAQGSMDRWDLLRPGVP